MLHKFLIIILTIKKLYASIEQDRFLQSSIKYELKSFSSDPNGYIYIGNEKLTDWCSATKGNLFWADMNGDGKSDLICQRIVDSDADELPGQIDVLLTNSEGLNYWKGAKPGKALSFCYDVNNQKQGKLFFQDFNKDKRADIFCVDVDSDFHYAENKSNGEFKSEGALFGDWRSKVQFGDLNGDTYLDYCTISWRCSKNKGGTSSEDIGRSVPLINDDSKYVLSDFNGDGTADMLWWDPRYGYYYAFLTSTDLKFTPINTERAKLYTDQYNDNARLYIEDIELNKLCLKDTGNVQWADFNGDGKTDLICNNNDGTYQVLLSNGTHKLKSATSSPKGYMTYNGVKVQNWCNENGKNNAQ
jgi:hypothetical protein